MWIHKTNLINCLMTPLSVEGHTALNRTKRTLLAYTFLKSRARQTGSRWMNSSQLCLSLTGHRHRLSTSLPSSHRHLSLFAISLHIFFPFSPLRKIQYLHPDPLITAAGLQSGSFPLGLNSVSLPRKVLNLTLVLCVPEMLESQLPGALKFFLQLPLLEVAD